MFGDKSSGEIQSELMKLVHKIRSGPKPDPDSYQKASEAIGEKYGVTGAEVRSFVARKTIDPEQKQLIFVPPQQHFKQLLESSDDKSLDILERQLQKEKEKRQKEKERKQHPFVGQYVTCYKEAENRYRVRCKKILSDDKYASLIIHDEKIGVRVAKWGEAVVTKVVAEKITN